MFVGVFFKNFLPLGIPGHLLSAGQIDVASVAVGLEVSGAFLVAWSEFLDQAIVVRPKPDRGAMSFLPFAIAAWLFLDRAVRDRLEPEPDPRRSCR